MKKTPLRRASKKRAADLKIYRAVAPSFLEDNPRCQCPGPDGRPCPNEATQIHHMKGRLGPLLTDVQWWMAVCQACHVYIEDHKKEARKRGLILYK